MLESGSGGESKLMQLLRGEELRLSKSHGKIAAVVLDDPRAAIHLSIARLAKLAGVSEPTVNRLCRKLGCDGYPDFKLKLAQEISGGGHLFVEDVDTSDDTAAVMRKILDTIQENVRSISRFTTPASIDAATKLLADSRSIYFFGTGASGPVALDAQHKFFRFGIPVVAQTDFINQRMMCSMITERDAAVFISYTGRTKAIIESAHLARSRGARTIGLTHADTPLAKECMVVLNAITPEDTDIFTPMTSRIIHLVLIDVLATRLAIELGEPVEQNIRSIKENLRDTRQ